MQLAWSVPRFDRIDRCLLQAMFFFFQDFYSLLSLNITFAYHFWYLSQCRILCLSQTIFEFKEKHIGKQISTFLQKKTGEMT